MWNPTIFRFSTCTVNAVADQWYQIRSDRLGFDL